MPSLTTQTVRGLSWTASGTLIQVVVQLAVTSILARFLSPADFGLAAAAMLIIGFGQMFAQFGIGGALVQRHKLARRHIQTGFLVSLLLGLFVAILLSALASVIAAFFRLKDLTLILYALAPLFILRSCSVVASSLLQRELRFRALTTTQIFSYFVGYGVIGLIAAIWWTNVWALVIAHLAQTVLETLCLLILRPHIKRIWFNKQAFKDLIDFGGNMTLFRFANFIALQGDNFVVGRWLGAEALGFYSRAFRLISLPANLFNEVVEKVVFATMSKSQTDLDRLKVAYRRGMSFMSLLVLPTTALTFILAPEIIFILLGPNWNDTIPILQILALGMYARVGYKMPYLVAISTGESSQIVFLKIIHATLILFGALGGQFWGVWGVAVGVVIAFNINYLLVMRLGIQITQINLRNHLNMHLPAIMMTAVTVAVGWGVVSLLRNFSSPTVVTFGVTSAIVLSVIAVLVLLFPTIVLGKEGVWWLETLLSFIKKKHLPRYGEQVR